MIAPVVTKRYAEALFASAREKHAVAEVEADLAALSQALARPDVARVALNPAVDPKRKRAALLDPLAPQLKTELVRNAIALLLDRRREDVLPRLREVFHRLALEASGEAEGVLESARPLDAAETRSVEEALGRALGKRVRLAPRVDSKLIGGVRATVGSLRYDATAGARLLALRERMLAARLDGAAQP